MQQIRSYLYQLVQELNFLFNSGGNNAIAESGAADGSVTTDKIADGAVTPAKLSFTPITPLDVYPVGAIYTSTDATSPAAKWGGTWEQIYAGYDDILVASQTVVDSLITPNTATEYTNIIGIQGIRLFDGLFENRVQPPAYHRELAITAETYGAGGTIWLGINNCGKDYELPWGGLTYREIFNTRFKAADIVLEQTMNFGTQGTNLKYKFTPSSSGSPAHIDDITLSAYFTSDDIIYKWRRTA